MTHRNLVLAALALTASTACRTDDGMAQVDENVMGLSVEIDAYAMGEVEGSWMGTLESTGDVDTLGLAGSEVLTVMRVLEYDADAAEVDMSFRFDLENWLTGIGTGSLMSNEIGAFDAIVHGPEGVNCLVDGDWSTGTGSIYIEFNCTDDSGQNGSYLLEARPF
jgi:hypothetical protein